MTHLKLSWLGSPIIERDNRAIHMETRKATALLAYLGLSPEPLPREILAALFWSEFDQSHAHMNLRRALFSINRTLGPGILVSTRETIGVDHGALVRQDVGEFRSLLAAVKGHDHRAITACTECIQSLERAVKLYRGDFLQGVNLRDCPDFDDWQTMQREGLRSNLAFSLETLAQAYANLGEWEPAILAARQWVALDPLHEAAHRRLIEVYASAGQRSAALRQVEECTRLLRDELGQQPESETRALARRIRSGETGGSVEPSPITAPEPSVRVTNEPLIKLKLFVPHLRAGLVSRPHLIGKLDQAAQCALTLISAPAGYGKTTLLSEWIALRKVESSSPWTVCWLSLDARDDDPIRFLTYLTAAVGTAHPESAAETRNLLQSSQSLHPTMPLSILINDLGELAQTVIIVLDDYQFISHQTIHEGIVFMLEHIPANVHLVIATRSDPPFPLARLRGRNLLNELRARDLRFTPAEAAAFLEMAAELSLTPEQIAVLDHRTEGWIAGLQMAAISMQGRSDITHFIEMFSGSHRFIMDYLTEEALNRQPAETQAFLLHTSILERLSEPLCRAVLTGSSDEEIQDPPSGYGVSIIPYDGRSYLTELEASNLFIVPLDDSRTWYRYHHLFADLLRTRVEQTSPGVIPTLHSRASAWFETNGWIEESITHALAAKDWGNASRLLDRHFHTYLEAGQMATVLKWIEGFPQDVIFRYPKLCIQVAEVYTQAGMMDQIDPLLDRAEEIVTAREPHLTDPEIAQVPQPTRKDAAIILSMAAILRGLKAVCAGDPSRALALTRTALADIPDMAPRELANLFWVEGWVYRSLGDLDRVLDSLAKAETYALESGAILHDIWTDLGTATRLAGKLPQAIEVFVNSLGMAADHGGQNQGNLSRDESFLSLIFLEQNQLDLALAHAGRAIAYTQWWPSHISIAFSHACLAQILLVRNDLNGSIRAIQKADQERRNRLVTPFVHSLADATWARIRLMQGRWDLLDQWADDQTSILATALRDSRLIDEYLEMRLIMLVRVWMEKTRIDNHPQRYEDCLRLVERVEASSQATGRMNSLVEILILKESIRFAQGKTSEALRGLQTCLSIAEAGGYMRIFLDTGEPARVLLLTYLQKPNPMHKPYALKILKAFGNSLRTSVSTNELPEAITPREMDVLHLLAEGCSNRQMAEKLVLAEGTIKYHVHQILGKLQVKSRTQAIIRARDLELI